MRGQQAPLDLGRWRNFTDMKTVRTIASATDSLWAATSGGLFLFNPSSNLFAKFTVDSLKLAMIKDDMVAKRRGGKIFDTICKFDPAQ